MASPPVRLALAMALDPLTSRSPAYRRRCPSPDPKDAASQSVVGCAAHSRRAPEIGHPDRRNDRRQISRSSTGLAVADLAHLSANACVAMCVHGLLYGFER